VKEIYLRKNRGFEVSWGNESKNTHGKGKQLFWRHITLILENRHVLELDMHL